jgi:dUTPase
MLTKAEIENEGLIIGGVPAGYRASSYDVHIGQILSNDAELRASFKMPPQGIVQVISRERVRLPSTVTGLATVKTGLCNEGLLALNIGIIDPGYEGPISSFLLNFSNVPRVLTRGEPFLRLQFIPLPNAAHVAAPTPVDHALYIAERRRQAARFGETFLNLSEQVRTVARDEFVEWRRAVLSAAGAAALVLAVLTFFLNWGIVAFVKEPSDTVRAELFRTLLNDQTAQLSKTNDELRARLDALEARVRSSPPTSGAHP